MDWDDLRFFLAVARAGSVRGAAELLGVNHSTVSRRINAFEEKQGARLFDRLPTGFALTSLGREIFELAGEIESKFTVLERRVTGRDSDLQGKVSLALNGTFVAPLGAAFARFQQEYPDIQIEVLAGLHSVNLTKREADIAIRVTNDPPENMIGKKIADMAIAIYASPAYLERMVGIKKLDEHYWIGWEKGLVQSAYNDWLENNIPSKKISFRANNDEAVIALTRAGLGLCHQLCFLGDRDPLLARAFAQPLPTTVGLWLLSHPDLRQTTRVKKLLHHLEHELLNHRDLIEGRR